MFSLLKSDIARIPPRRSACLPSFSSWGYLSAPADSLLAFIFFLRLSFCPSKSACLLSFSIQSYLSAPADSLLAFLFFPGLSSCSRRIACLPSLSSRGYPDITRRSQAAKCRRRPECRKRPGNRTKNPPIEQAHGGILHSVSGVPDQFILVEDLDNSAGTDSSAALAENSCYKIHIFLYLSNIDYKYSCILSPLHLVSPENVAIL